MGLTRKRAQELLETYTLQELMEMGDLDEEDVLMILVNNGHLTLPETQPL